MKADDPFEVNGNHDFKLTLLGPTQEALNQLADAWFTYLEKIFKGKINEDAFFDDAFEKMMEELRQAELAKAVLDQEELVAASGDWVADHAVAWEHDESLLYQWLIHYVLARIRR